MKTSKLFIPILLLLPALFTPPAEAAYVLRTENGFLVVREGDHLLCETAVPVSSLPERDRKKLETGLILEDQAALTTALEDFCS